MGVRILVGQYDYGRRIHACLVDSVTDFAFGQLLDDEAEAQEFIDYCDRRGSDPRILSDGQLADHGPWFDNHRRLRELIAELEALSLDIAEADPRWNR